MNRKYVIANAILWAAAIIASAIVGAPTVLSVVLLPALAVLALLLADPKACRSGPVDSVR
jgi:hypothetical protein